MNPVQAPKPWYQNPVVVGFLRGLGLAVGATVVNYAVMYVTAHPLPIQYQPAVVLGLRVIEGMIDNGQPQS